MMTPHHDNNNATMDSQMTDTTTSNNRTKGGGHHLDLCTYQVDYVVYNVLDPHIHLLWVSNPPNPVQTPNPTPEIPLPMEKVKVGVKTPVGHPCPSLMGTAVGVEV